MFSLSHAQLSLLSLVQRIADTPASVTSLDLSRNRLGAKTGAELTQALAAIPASVTSLDLSWNGLGAQTDAELAQVLAAIPANVTSLNLSENRLSAKTGAELAQVLAAIPASVTSLNLSGNGLGAKTGAELAQALAAIPATVTSLYLTEDALDNTTGAELTQALAAHALSISLAFEDLVNANANLATMRNYLALVKQAHAIPQIMEKVLLSPTQAKFDETLLKNKQNEHEWGRICPFISFFRANKENPLRNSVIPVIDMVAEYRGMKPSRLTTM
jgi:hypothetical protein